MQKAWKIIAKCASALTLALTPAAPAQAQIPVIDPANLAQSIVQVAQAIEQIHNQVQQIEQGAAMLRRNPLQLSPGLSRSIGETRALFESVEGVAFEADRLGEELRTLYPETWAQFDLGAILAQSERWMDESRASLERAMQAEARAAEQIGQTQGRIEDALQSSAGSEGQTGAIQAGNQLLGVEASELAEIHALLIAQGRALETERMERIAREQRAGEVQKRAFPEHSHVALDPARSVFH